MVAQRALGIAAGVPLSFALLAAGLSGLTTPARADSSATGGARPAAHVAAASASTGVPTSVRRDLVRPIAPPVAVDWHLSPSDRVAFLTIDDGVTKDARALRLVERLHLPITAFVSAWTVKDRADYFRRITAWGSVQNHSATHASLARSRTDLDHEICYAQKALARDFGTTPWLLRPPYGAGYQRMETQVTAARCGITQMVMWDAVVDDGRVTSTGNGLRPGSVILLHFTPGLAADLRAALKAMQRAHLRPADLADYLPRTSVSREDGRGAAS